MAASYHNSQAGSALHSLHFGVGVNTGMAVVGNVGAQWHYQYTAIGDAVNVASRICSHARPGEVLIGEDTYKYLEDRITADALAPMKFKGKSQEITVYQVRGMEGNYLSFNF
jgi:adenylate cyclase